MTHAPDRDRGFTLVEVLVAVLLLATLAVGAAALATAAGRAALGARTASSAQALARQKHEQLRALTWAVNEAGVPVTDNASNISGETATTGGPGTDVSPPGALDANLAGWSDYVDVDGRWVSAAALPSARASFARRWGIERLPDSGGATLVVRVVVTPIAWSSRRIGRGAGAVHASEAAIVSFRSRTAR